MKNQTTIDVATARAVASQKNFKRGNTSVHVNGNVVTVKLHGNVISVYKMDGWLGRPELRVTNAGYNTRTTARRINAILSAFDATRGRVYVFIQKRQMCITRYGGKPSLLDAETGRFTF